MGKLTIPTDKVARLGWVAKQIPDNPMPAQIQETLNLLAEMDEDDVQGISVLLLTRHDILERLLIEREILGREYTTQGAL